VILVYVLPFFAAYVMAKRVEERVKIRTSYYFVIAISLLVVYGVIIGIAYYPVPYPTVLLNAGNIMLLIPLLLVFIFITKIRKQVSGTDYTQIGGELLKLFLVIGGLICSLAIVAHHNNLPIDFQNLTYIIAGSSIILVCTLIMFSYIEIGIIYKRFTEKFWFLALFGGVIYTGLFITNLAEFVAVAGFGSIEIAPTYMSIQLKYGMPCTIIGGILATIPSITLYIKLCNRTFRVKIPSGDLRSFLEEMFKLVGGVTTDILKMGIMEYNLQFKRNIELTPELGIKNLRTGEDNSLAKYLVGVFSKRVGPIAYQIAEKKTSLF
jgi:hypothetical protein